MDKKKNYTNFLNLCDKIQKQYYNSVIEQHVQKKQLEKEFFRFTKEMDLTFKNWLTQIRRNEREKHISNYERKVKIELNTYKINRNTFEIKKSQWILKQIYFWKDHHHSIKYISSQESEIKHEKNYFTFNEDEKKFNSKINIENLNLVLENQFSYGEEFKSGLSEFNFLNSKSILEYKIGKNNFEFKLFDKAQKSKFSYNGKLNFRPFHSYLMGSATTIDFSHLFSDNAIIKQLLKTEILNNKNIDFKLNVSANKTKNFDSFKNIFLNLKIQEGLIDLDQTKFSWKNHANFSLTDSLIYLKNGKLVLDANSEIKLINLDEIYKFLITPKNLRKKINKMNINFTYLFDEKTLNINDIKVDGISDKNILNNLNEINLKENSLQNKIYLKNLLNKAIKSYAG